MVWGLQFCSCNLELLLLLGLNLQQESFSVCSWQGILSLVQNSCDFCCCIFSYLNTVYLAEIITGEKKKKTQHFELLPVLESGVSIGENIHFHVWRLAMGHFASQGPSLREYWDNWSIPRRNRGFKTANYNLCICQISVLNEDSFSILILSFLAPSLPHPHSFIFMVALSILLLTPSPFFQFIREF